MNLQITIILVNFILIVFFLLLNSKLIKKGLNKIGKKTWLFLAIIFLFGLFLRIPFEPSYIMFIDEPWNMESAKNILKTGEPSLCSFTDVGTKFCGQYPKPLGFSFLLSVVFLFFGISPLTGIYLSVLTGSLSIFLVFLSAYLFFKNEQIGLWSSLLIALNPIHIIWSKTAETNATSIFFILLAFMFILIYFKNKTPKTLILSLLLLAFTVNMRPENILFILLFGILFFFEKKKPQKTRILENIRDPKKIVIFSIFIIMLIPYIVFVVNTINNPIPYTYEEGKYYGFLSIENVVENWPENNPYVFFLSGQFHPLIFGIFSLLSLLFLRTSMKKRILFLWIWFSLFYIIVISRFIVQDRYLLNLYLPLTILAGYSIFKFSLYFKGYFKKPVIGFLILILICLSFYPHVQNSMYYKDDYRTLETWIPLMVKDTVDENCYVIVEYATVLLSVTDVKAVEDPIYVEGLVNKTGCVFFLKDIFMSPYMPEYNARADVIKSGYNLTLYETFTHGYATYNLYRVSIKKP